MSEVRFTKEQTDAITARGGALLVSAAAGSGKTAVLVERLMRRITDPESPVNIDRFLIVTYTNAAAAEMRGKISAALAQRLAENPADRNLRRQMDRLGLTQIETVHAFCMRLIRENAAHLPPSFVWRTTRRRVFCWRRRSRRCWRRSMRPSKPTRLFPPLSTRWQGSATTARSRRRS